MAGRKIRQERFQILDKLGIDGLEELYWDCSGIREVATKLFKPEREGQVVGVSSIYDWINERGLRKEWQKIVWIKKEMAEMSIVDEAGDLPPTRASMSYLNKKMWEARRGGGHEVYAMKYGLHPPRTPQNDKDDYWSRVAKAEGKRGEEA